MRSHRTHSFAGWVLACGLGLCAFSANAAIATFTVNSGTIASDKAWVDGKSGGMLNTRTLTFNVPTGTVPAGIPAGAIIASVTASVSFSKYSGPVCPTATYTTGPCSTDGGPDSWPDEIYLRLTAPSGTARRMVNSNPPQYRDDGGAAAYTNISVTFADSAATKVSGDPVSGNFKPDQAFSSFVNQSPHGNWTLTFGDQWEGDPLQIHSWSLTINYELPDVSGRVFDDVNYGGGAGRAYGAAGSTGIAGARVELYTESPAGSGNYLHTASTTTAADGAYIFADQTSGNYRVRVVNNATHRVPSSRAGDAAGVFGIQTYRTDASSGTATAVTNEIGGRDPTAAADADTATAVGAPFPSGALNWAPVTVNGANVASVDFGFNFDTIVNTNDAGLGSLRQFIINANALANTGLAQAGLTAGRETSIFMIPSGALTGGVAQIHPTTALPAITGADTALDGTTQTSNIGNTNAGQLGSGGTVGVDAVALAQVNRPEVQLRGNRSFDGITVQASGTRIRGLSLYGFSDDIQVDSGTAVVIEDNVLGSSATSFADPGAGVRTQGINVNVQGGGVTVQRNLIGYAGRSGIDSTTSTTGLTAEYNEIHGASQEAGNGEGLQCRIACLIRYNHIAASQSGGIDMHLSAGGANIDNNTLSGNGTSGAATERFGLRLYGAGNTVRRNVIHDNAGAGIQSNADSATSRITQNSVFNNGTATGQLGIDLLGAADDNAAGTAPFYTLNDDGDGDSGANGLINFPVVEQAVISSSNLILTGWARPGSVIEVFIAQANPSGFGEGQTFVASLTEGSGADLDATASSYGPTVNGVTVATGAVSENRFRFSIAVPGGVSVGTLLTATATDASNNTSEFSANVNVQRLDYGDAPDSGAGTASGNYATTAADDGAAHAVPVSPTVYLGSVAPDGDTGLLQNSTADADDSDGTDDEDGIASLPTLASSDTTYSLTINASNASGSAANLVCWIDLDRDGAFEPVEAAYAAVASGAPTPRSFTLLWSKSPQPGQGTLPASLGTGDTYVRCRISTSTALTPAASTGLLPDGEVEDFRLGVAGSLTLAGTVFEDTGAGAADCSTQAHNGTRDGSEPGIAKVLVRLLHDVDGDGLCNGNETVLAQAHTLGTGGYTLRPATADADKHVCLVANPLAGYRGVSESSGGHFVNGADTADAVMAFTLPSAGTSWAGLDFGLVRPASFAPSHTSAVMPGSGVTYSHTLTAGTCGTVAFSEQITLTPTLSGWQQLLYRDADCDGALSAAEAAAPLGGSIALGPGERLCLVLKVNAPADVPFQAQHRDVISANFSLTNTALGTSLSVTDLTRIEAVQGRLQLDKSVRNLGPDGTAGTGDDVDGSEQIRNQARPADVLRYTIVFTNVGSQPIADVVLHDVTPAFTALSTSITCPGSLPANLGGCILATPSGGDNAAGYEGPVEWRFTGTLAPGTHGSVSYGVRVQ